MRPFPHRIPLSAAALVLVWTCALASAEGKKPPEIRKLLRRLLSEIGTNMKPVVMNPGEGAEVPRDELLAGRVAFIADGTVINSGKYDDLTTPEQLLAFLRVSPRPGNRGSSDGAP